MPITQEQAIEFALADLAKRQGVSTNQIEVVRQENTQFSNGALGAALEGEMSSMMMTPGWRLILRVQGNGTEAEYRANAKQVRLFGYQGAHYKIYP